MSEDTKRRARTIKEAAIADLSLVWGHQAKRFGIVIRLDFRPRSPTRIQGVVNIGPCMREMRINPLLPREARHAEAERLFTWLHENFWEFEAKWKARGRRP